MKGVVFHFDQGGYKCVTLVEKKNKKVPASRYLAWTNYKKNIKRGGWSFVRLPKGKKGFWDLYSKGGGGG